jgi:peptidyl-prolyl cis-trans isomerase D
MLPYLRKYSRSRVLYGFLAAVFIAWGVGAVGLTGMSMDVIATVHGEPITRRQLDRTMGLLQRRYDSIAQGLSPDLLKSLDIPGKALDELIDGALLAHEAARLGITPSEEDVLLAITQIPELQQNGQFDRARLAQFLEQERDRGEFEDDMRRQLLYQRLQAVATDGIQVTDTELAERYRLDHEKVRLAFVRIPAKDLEAGITFTEEELVKYHREHGEQYRVPPRVRARYVVWRAADIAPSIELTENDVATWYEANGDQRFALPERIRVRLIAVKTAVDAPEAKRAEARKKADDILAEIRGGGDFAAIAKKRSDDRETAAKGGELGLIEHGKLSPALDAAAWALNPGEVSDVVETPEGFDIVKVEERLDAGLKPLEDVRAEVEKDLRTERAFAQARSEAEAARRAIVNGKPFADAVAPRKVEETAPFIQAAPIAGIGRVPDFNETAFALDDGDVSDLVETTDAVYLLSPFGREDTHIAPLDEVRSRVENDLRRSQAEKVAKEKAEQILARAKEIGLDRAAEEAKRRVEVAEPFDRRTATIPSLGFAPEVHDAAFGLTAEAPLGTRVYAAGGDAVLIALRERIPADMAGLEAEKAALGQQVLSQRRAAAFEAFVSYLKERAQREGEITVRPDALGRS